MLRQRSLGIFIVTFAIFSTVFGLYSPRTVQAGSGTIDVFHIFPDLTGHIRVSCPGDVGFTWRAGDEFRWYVEDSTKVGNFYFPKNQISVGSHNAIAELRCGSESWDGATKSTVGFVWNGDSAQDGGVTMPQGNNNSGNSGNNNGGSNYNNSSNVGSNNGGGKPSVNQARQSISGGVDLNVWCAANGLPIANNNSGRWDGWYCGDARVSWSRVCTDVWGTPSFSHGSDQNSIRCGGSSSGNNASSNSTPIPKKTPMTNAYGQPLQTNGSGDEVYPRARGTGTPFGRQYVYIASKYDGLFLRTSPDNSNGRRDNVIATLNPNDYYTVVQVGSGWIKIQTSLGEGWVSSQYAELHSNSTKPQNLSPVTSDLTAPCIAVSSAQLRTAKKRNLRACAESVLGIGIDGATIDIDYLIYLASNAADVAQCLQAVAEAIANSQPYSSPPYVVYIPQPKPDFAQNCYPVGNDIIEMFNKIKR